MVCRHVFFSVEDRYLIKSLRETKGYGAKKLIAMFPEKHWSCGLNYLIQNIGDIGNVNRLRGSGRQRSPESAESAYL